MQQRNEKNKIKIQNCDSLFEMFWIFLKTSIVWNPIFFHLNFILSDLKSYETVS
jgi:hypothetical protein